MTHHVRVEFIVASLRDRQIRAIAAVEAKPLSDDEVRALKTAAADVRADLATLVRNGSCVPLMDIPREPVLDGSVRARMTRNLLQAEFPAPRFRWIELPRENRVTSDGTHLNRAAANMLARDAAKVAHC
ncbi:MAG: hypothetical protein WDN01_08375 [Rhizomicrobium sp.]